MASLSRYVHPQANVDWRPFAEMCPDVQASFGPAGDDEVPMGLSFTDPDGEAHVYIFSEKGRKILLEKLTGGVVLAEAETLKGGVVRAGGRAL